MSQVTRDRSTPVRISDRRRMPSLFAARPQSRICCNSGLVWLCDSTTDFDRTGFEPRPSPTIFLSRVPYVPLTLTLFTPRLRVPASRLRKTQPDDPTTRVNARFPHQHRHRRRRPCDRPLCATPLPTLTLGCPRARCPHGLLRSGGMRRMACQRR
jgi:hypothetical protein